MPRYVFVGKVGDIPPGSRRLVNEIDRVDVLVFNHEGKYFAVSNICPHKGGPLSEGGMKGGYLECPWHMAKFRVDDGKGYWPSPRGLRRFPVKVDGDSIYVETLL